MKTPLLFAAALPALFTIGGISGVILAIFPVDWYLHDTYFVVAHFHFVLFGGSVFGIFAGLYYWFPKMTGRLMSEFLGKLSFGLMFVGFLATFLVQHSMGLEGMPRRIYDYDDALGVEVYNLISTIGAFILGVGVLVTVVNVLWSLKNGQRVGNDPWRGNTLEWFTTLSPAAQQLRRGPARAQRGADEGHPPRGGRRGEAGRDRRAARRAAQPVMRRLVLATGIATFVLILVGGVVRVSDSGLGCGPAGSGFHGWPFCNGDVVPGVDLNSIVEYTHRVLAIIVGFMILAIFVLAWRRQRAFLAPAAALLVLVIAQGALGGATVEENLEEVYVAAHLGLAMLLLGLLLHLWRGVSGASVTNGGPRMRALGIAASVAVLCTIVAGGYMAGTQNYGRADYQLGDGAHHACGKEFPTCNGELMPFGKAELVDIHLTHRAFMYLASLLVIALVVVAVRRGVLDAPRLGARRAARRTGPRRRPERVARRVRAADPAAPRARHAALGHDARHDARSSRPHASARGARRRWPPDGSLVRHTPPPGARSSRTTSR